jgi:serine/tyrosine/threonine adenylyltransferase
MAALGVPTTRSLAAVTTGETVRRETPLPGAVLTRVASSHIRVGTFQFFAARGDVDAIRHLADHVIARHYPEAADAANPHRVLLDMVIARQAELVAKWLLVGFIHGVMNTDNMSIAGETIDYGPCAFMDAYDPATVYSSIDTVGRYAYGNQPRIAKWNLARLAETLLPLLAEDKDAALEEANEALGGFATRFETAYAAGLRRKLGLFQARPDDLALAQDLLERMARNGADFTLTLRRLCDAAVTTDGDAAMRSLFTDPTACDDWVQRWRLRLAEDGSPSTERRASMRAVNPAFIPRNHLVEEALSAAVNKGDLSPFETLLTVVSRPYEDQPAFGRYAVPPRPDQIVRQTFCGT